MMGNYGKWWEMDRMSWTIGSVCSIWTVKYWGILRGSPRIGTSGQCYNWELMQNESWIVKKLMSLTETEDCN
jgi:hypothetical protein